MQIDIRDFGAVADAKTDSTPAIEAAIHAAAQSGSRRSVTIPSGGVFVARSFALLSNIILEVQGTLRGVVDEKLIVHHGKRPQPWPIFPPLPTYGRDRDGAKPGRYRALIYADRASNVTICGSGVIDGSGPWWWSRKRSLPFGRPHLIELHNSSNLQIHGITLKDSPFWTVHLAYSQHIHVHDVTIRAPLYAPNTDGIDPDSCRDVLIERCDISVGDDHIAVKAGLSPVAREGFPQYLTENVVVRHNVLRAGMGISIGSETSGGIRNVSVHHNTFLGSGWSVALHVKSAAQRGRFVEDVTFADNEVTNTTAFLRLDSFGRSLDPESYRPTAIRRISWLRNRFLNDAGGSDGGKRVRAKFICPSRAGGCSNISIINNTHSTPALASWHCDGISSFEVHGNTPGGLEKCMKRGQRAMPRKQGGARPKTKPRKSRHKRRVARGGRENNQQKVMKYRRFDWKTQTASWKWSTTAE